VLLLFRGYFTILWATKWAFIPFMNRCVGCIYSVMNRCVGCIFVLMNVGVYSVMNSCMGWIFVLMTVGVIPFMNCCVGCTFIFNDCGCSKFSMRSYVRGGFHVYVYNGISYRGIFITVAFSLYSGIFFLCILDVLDCCWASPL
jgi:hypothetical protein